MIILTGANGYIGKELTKYFDKQNVEYTAYSRSFSVKQIKNPSKFKITNYNSIKAGGTLLYLSDNSNFEFYNKLSKNELNNQIKTTKKILNKKFNKIIYFSTALIDKEFVTENEKYFNYLNYKKKIEEFVILKKGVVLRIANVISQKPKKGTFVSDFLKFNRNFKNIKIRDDIWRDFIFIDDVINLLNTIILTYNISGIYNVASGKQTNLADLAKVLHNYKLTGKIRTINLKKYKHSINIKKTKQKFKWTPESNINYILKKILNK